MLQTGEFQERARTLGARLEAGLHELVGHGVAASGCGGCGPASTSTRPCSCGRELCEGLLSGGCWPRTPTAPPIRLAPPLVASEADIDILLDAIGGTLKAAIARA